MKSLTLLARECARKFEELSPRAIFVLSLVSILFIGAADFGTPGGMSFTLFYVIVCALAGWRAGRQSAAVLCLFALAMIVVHDVTSIPIPKNHPWILAWNLSTRIIVVSVSTWLATEVSRLTRSLSNLIEERTNLWQTEVKQQAWILENMGEALIMTDAAGKIEVLNPAAERLMGYSAAELNGQSITLLSPFSEQQTPEKFRSLQETLDRQPQWEGELPIRRKDGQVLIAQVNVTRLQHDHRNMVIALYQDVTRQREAEAQLRARDERLQLGLEAGRMITWEADLTSGVIIYSQSANVFFGSDDLQRYLTLEAFARQVHPDDRAIFLQKQKSVVAEGNAVEHEYRVATADGTYLWVLTKGRPILGESGKAVRLRGVSLDITERKKAEELLRQQAQILEQTHDSIVASDLDGRIMYSNKGTERLLGYPAQELVGKHISLLHFEEDMPMLRDTVLGPVKANGQHEIEVRARHQSGEEVFVLLSLSLLRDADGVVRGIIGSATNITERRTAEVSLRESEKTYRALIETTGTGYLILDLQGQVLDANDKYVRLSGHKSLNDILGKSVIEWTAPRDVQRNALAVADCVKTGRVLGLEVDYAGPNGQTIPIEINATVVQTRKGRRILSLCRDITQRRNAEQQLADALELNLKMVTVSPVGIAAYKESGQCVFANEAMARIIGGSVERILAQNFRELRSWRETRLLESAKEALRNGRAETVETRVITTFGKDTWLQCDFTRLVSGSEVHLLAMFHDVSERRKAQESLALSQSQLVAAMDLAALANWEYDFVAGRYCFDDRFYALYGTTADREGGNQMTPQVYASEFMFPEDDYMVFQGLASASATNDPNWSVHLEHRIRRRDGQLRHLAVRAAVIKDAAGKTVKLRGVNQDITDRKRAEQQILEISDREQARIGQDLHDGLCQQLVSLAFDANALQRKLTGQGLPEAAAATRLADFLDQAITESRRVSRGLFPIRLEAEGLASALEELARTTHSRFNIQCQFESPQLVSVPDLAVATHLYRIAQEAVNNSIKHGKSKSIAIRLSTADSALELIVEDDGIGLSSAIPESRSGMGLYIMRYRASSIGATLNFGPRPTGGTVVTCNLKRFPAQSVRQNPVETHFNGEN